MVVCLPACAAEGCVWLVRGRTLGVKEGANMKYCRGLAYCGVVLSVVVMWGLVSVAQAGIATTKHNLSVAGPGNVKSIDETEICVFCHTPHRAIKNRRQDHYPGSGWDRCYHGGGEQSLSLLSRWHYCDQCLEQSFQCQSKRYSDDGRNQCRRNHPQRRCTAGDRFDGRSPHQFPVRFRIVRSGRFTQ